MQFDRAKYEDEYIKIHEIDLKKYPDYLMSLYMSAARYRKDAVNVYKMLTSSLYTKFPQLIDIVYEYIDLEEYQELNELIKNSRDEEVRVEYVTALQEWNTVFKREGAKWNDEITALYKSMKDYAKSLMDNSREDLSSGAFFYGQTENAMKNMGAQIEELALIIKTIYIEPMNVLKEKIKKYDEEIDAYLDPQNAFDNFMNAMPTADEFGSLLKFTETNADSQVAAMQAAYAVAIKGITYIGKKIVNLGSMEERRKLQDELDALQESYDKQKELYEKRVDEYNAVKNLVIILEGMKFFGKEAEKFVGELAVEREKQLEAYQNAEPLKYYECVKNMEEFLSVFWKDNVAKEGV